MQLPRLHGRSGLPLAVTGVSDNLERDVMLDHSLRRCARWMCALMVAVAVVVVVPFAQAEPTKADKAQAGKRFRDAERLYKKGDYRRAAELFEEAYVLAPHPDALLNAADAYEKAEDLALAAEVCARLLRDTEVAASKVAAERRLERLAPRIGRVRIQLAKPADSVSINGSPAREGDIWVQPGTHHVEARFGDKTVSQQTEAKAGQLSEVTLDPDPPKAPEAPPPVESSGWDRPLHPAFFFVGLGLTAGSAVLLTWSGVDTNSARDDFDQNPTRAGLEDGEGKQTRTNVLVATTLLLGTATGLIGGLAVEWSGSDSGAEGKPEESASPTVSANVGPTGIWIQGSF